MINSKKFNNILIISIIGTIFLMSMGYSVKNKELMISGDLIFRPKADIRITNISQKELSNATIQYANFSQNEISFAYDAQITSASVILEVEVTNYTDTHMGIFKIENLPENATIEGYNLKETLKNSNGALKAGDSTTFTITFTATQSGIQQILLKFDFKQMYNIIYSGFDDINDFKTEIINGDTLTQYIGEETQICSVTMNDKAISNYKFLNGVIEISDITSNIIIECFILKEEPPTTPNPPVLNGDMIPVRYQQLTTTTGNWVKADNTNKDNDWYDYANQKWANAVTIISDKRQEVKEYSAGTVIPMDYINTMWVWIPRYSYTIKKEIDSSNYYGKRTSCAIPSQKLPGEIDIKFIPTSEDNVNGNAQYTGDKAVNWRTNEAFNFPETDENGQNTKTARAGIWVGKFEITGSYSARCKDETCDVSGVTILPDKASITNKTVSNFFYMARSMQVSYAQTYGFNADSGDLHMMKNDEWGAVAYLSQSRYGKYGNGSYSGANKEVYKNNNYPYITGTSGGRPVAGYSSSGAKYKYNDMTELGEGKGQAGPGASTTGTIYGVYDMSGGAWEYVMGVLEYDSQTENEHPGEILTGSSGFKGLDENGTETGTIDLPDKKYYNTYKTVDPTSSSSNASTACDGGVCYGHALFETRGWYSDYAIFVTRSSPWIRRGDDYYSSTSSAGVFSANSHSGGSYSGYSVRLVLV